MHELLQAHIASKYFAVASLTFLVYDIALTLDNQIHYIHNAQWGISKVLFLLNRYCVPCLLIIHAYALFNPSLTPETCNRFSIINATGAVVASIIINLVLILRVYALWNQSRRILFWVCTLYLLTLGAVAIVISRAISSDPLPDSRPLQGIAGCISNAPERFWSLFVFTAVFEIVIFVLTVIKAIGHQHSGVRTPVITQLLQDGAAYFVAMFLCMIFNAVAAQFPVLALPVLSSEFILAMSSMLCSHLLLRIRAAGEQPVMGSATECVVAADLLRVAPAAPTSIPGPFSPSLPTALPSSSTTLPSTHPFNVTIPFTNPFAPASAVSQDSTKDLAKGLKGLGDLGWLPPPSKSWSRTVGSSLPSTSSGSGSGSGSKSRTKSRRRREEEEEVDVVGLDPPASPPPQEGSGMSARRGWIRRDSDGLVDPSSPHPHTSYPPHPYPPTAATHSQFLTVPPTDPCSSSSLSCATSTGEYGEGGGGRKEVDVPEGLAQAVNLSATWTWPGSSTAVSSIEPDAHWGDTDAEAGGDADAGLPPPCTTPPPRPASPLRRHSRSWNRRSRSGSGSGGGVRTWFGDMYAWLAAPRRLNWGGG